MKIYKKGNYILFDNGVILNMEHANQTMLNKDSINKEIFIADGNMTVLLSTI